MIDKVKVDDKPFGLIRTLGVYEPKENEAQSRSFIQFKRDLKRRIERQQHNKKIENLKQRNKSNNSGVQHKNNYEAGVRCARIC